MESIEKLREKSLNYAPNIRRDVNMALNEIEREIAELEQLIRDYHDATDDILTEHDYLLACGFEQRIRELLGGDAE